MAVHNDATGGAVRAGAQGPQGRRRPRLWRLVPPPSGDPHAPEAFDGEHILSELGDRPGAVLIWQVYRDALVWASTPSAHRTGLFRPAWVARHLALSGGADVGVPALLAANRLAAALHEGGSGGRAAGREALSLGEHFASAGAPRTAVAFAKVAHALDPYSPATAIRAAEMAMDAGRGLVADVLAQRAVGLARRVRSLTDYAAATACLGTFREQAGKLDAAERLYTRVIRVARRAGKPALESRRTATCGLLRLALAAQRVDDAARYAQTALRLFPVDHPHYPRVALDAADAALRRNDAPEAARLIGALPVAAVPPSDALRLLVVQVRALGAVDSLRAAERAWEAASQIIATKGETPEAARLLLSLAEEVLGTLGPDRADPLATRALGIATRSDDVSAASRCRDALFRIREKRRERASDAA